MHKVFYVLHTCGTVVSILVNLFICSRTRHSNAHRVAAGYVFIGHESDFTRCGDSILAQMCSSTNSTAASPQPFPLLEDG